MTGATTAHGLRNLIFLWRSGQKNIDPSRSHDGFSVVDNVLYSRSAGQLTPFGVPVTDGRRWGFWYLVTLWRRRFVFRERLTGFGGFPVMPHELVGILKKKDRQHEAEEVGRLTQDVYRDDPEMFDALLAWLTAWPPKNQNVPWRGCEVRLRRDSVYVTRIVRSKDINKCVVLSRERHGLTLVGQVYRSQHALWLRDAVCVVISRLLGRGVLSGYIVRREGRVGLTCEGGVLPVPPTPEWPF